MAEVQTMSWQEQQAQQQRDMARAAVKGVSDMVNGLMRLGRFLSDHGHELPFLNPLEPKYGLRGLVVCSRQEYEPTRVLVATCSGIAGVDASDDRYHATDFDFGGGVLLHVYATREVRGAA